jgi:hypothetical protein
VGAEKGGGEKKKKKKRTKSNKRTSSHPPVALWLCTPPSINVMNVIEKTIIKGMRQSWCLLNSLLFDP